MHDFKLPTDAYGSDGRLQSTAPHRDTSVLTFLSTFDYEGLQASLGWERVLYVFPMILIVMFWENEGTPT